MSPNLQEMSDLSHLIKKSLMQNITFCEQVQSLVWMFNSISAEKNVSILPVLNFANFPITEFGISGHKKTFCITIPLFYGMQGMPLDYLKKHYLATQMKWMFYVFLEALMLPFLPFWKTSYFVWTYEFPIWNINWALTSKSRNFLEPYSLKFPNNF